MSGFTYHRILGGLAAKRKHCIVVQSMENRSST